MSPWAFFTVHTFRTMALGTAMVGGVAGALGALAYLRRQSLVGDMVGHSAIAGVMLAYLTASMFGVDGRNLWLLTAGAAIISTVAALLGNHVSATSKVGVDSTMAIMLSLFFGGGMVLWRVILNGRFKNKGGLASYLFGNAAVLTKSDLWATAILGGVCLIITAVCWKELKIFVFDSEFARTAGFSPRVVDAILFGLVVVAVVIGLKTVGLILMVALLVAPSVAARQWTRSVVTMTVLSGVIGALSGAGGSYLSVQLGRVPTGPAVVLALVAVALCSLLLAPQRSLLFRVLRRIRRRKELLALVHTPTSASIQTSSTLTSADHDAFSGSTAAPLS